MRKIYLAGPMENVTNAEMSGWRDHLTLHLAKAGWQVFDPCRRVMDDYNHKRIYELDMRDVRESDVLFADLRRGMREAHGTAMEVQEAYRSNIPVIGYATKDQKRHPFLEVTVTEWFTDFNRAIKVLNDFYL